MRTETKRPTFQELHGGPGGLIEKLAAYEAKKRAMFGYTVTDVTPAGYGPTETSDEDGGYYPASSHDHQTTEEQSLRRTIGEEKTLLLGKITEGKRIRVKRNLAKNAAKLAAMMDKKTRD